MVLTNRMCDSWRARYKLQHTVRVHDASDEAYEAVYQQQLHSLLQPYRMSTRLHTTMAFLAKAVCVPATHRDPDDRLKVWCYCCADAD